MKDFLLLPLLVSSLSQRKKESEGGREERVEGCSIRSLNAGLSPTFLLYPIVPKLVQFFSHRLLCSRVEPLLYDTLVHVFTMRKGSVSGFHGNRNVRTDVRTLNITRDVNRRNDPDRASICRFTFFWMGEKRMRMRENGDRTRRGKDETRNTHVCIYRTHVHSFPSLREQNSKRTEQLRSERELEESNFFKFTLSSLPLLFPVTQQSSLSLSLNDYSLISQHLNYFCSHKINNYLILFAN